MPKKLFYTLVQAVLIFQLILPATGYAIPVRLDTPLKLPLDNWSLGMFGVTVHDNAFVAMPEKSLKFSFVDLEIMGIGFPVRLERIYTGKPHPKGVLGKEWMLGIESWVDQADTNNIIITDSDRRSVFTKDDQGAFKNNGGSVVTKNADKTLLMTKKNGYSTLYSKNGLPLRVEGPHGNSLKYQYEEGRLARLEESSGRGLLFFYNSKHLLEEVSDDTGRTVAFRYDDLGRLVSVNRFNLQTTTISYNKTSQLSSIGLPGGLVLSIAYESSKPLQVKKITSNRDEQYLFETQQNTGEIKVSDHSGNSYYYSFYPSGQNVIVGISNDLGWLTGYSLDSRGRLAGWQKPNGDLLQYGYDPHDRLLNASNSAESSVEYEYRGLTQKPSKAIDSEGRETLFEYDKNLALTSISPPAQEAISFLRHPNGTLREYRQGDTSISTFSIDSQGNPVTVQSAATGKVSRTYDSLGRVITAQLGAGSKYSYRYNDFDQVTHIFRDRDLLIKYSYDSNGNIKIAKDKESGVSQYLYDENGRLSEVKTPNSKVFSIKRTENGYQSERLFPNSSSKTFSYNHAGLLTRVTDSFGKFRQYKWTPSLQLDRVINEDGSFVRYKYDAGGNLIAKKFSSGESHLFSYQGDRLVAMKSPQFHQEYVYDKQGKISITEDKVLGVTVNWDYDRFGRLKSVSSSNTGRIAYQYDQAGRTKSIVDPDSKETRYRYDLSGRVEAILYPNGVQQQYTYDEKHSAVSSILVVSGNKTLFHEIYVYNDNGLLKESRNNMDGSSKVHTYDPDGALVDYTHTQKRSGAKKWSYSYDDNGNMIEERRPEETIINKYEGIGRITQHGAGRMHHDTRGNLTTAVLDGDKFNLEYDYNGKLERVELPDGSFKQYRYDPLGRLVFYKKDGVERHIFWNGKERLFEIDGEYNLVKFYNHGPGLDNIVSVKKAERMYYHHDRLSSVRLVTNEQGEMVSSYDYTPFGMPLVDERESSFADGIVFAGRPYDSDLECYYVRARFYCPALKRFLSRDPLDGVSTLPFSWHPYLYAINNPVNFYDPEGEILAVIGGAIVLIVASGTALLGGVVVGTAINETAHAASQIVEKGPTEFLKEAIVNTVKTLGELSDIVLNAGFNSYSDSEYGQKDEQAGSGRRLANAKKLAEKAAPMNAHQKLIVNATNPNQKERDEGEQKIIAGYISDTAADISGKITGAIIETAKSKVIGDIRKKAGIDEGLKRLEEISGDVVGTVPGLSTVVNATADQASKIESDAEALALADAKKDGHIPEETVPEMFKNALIGSPPPSEVEAATTSSASSALAEDALEAAMFAVLSAGPTEPSSASSALAESALEGAMFSVESAGKTKSTAKTAAPTVNCEGIPGSIAVQGECICTDGLVLSPSLSRCIACTDYLERVRGLSAQGALDAAQAVMSEARACTSHVAQMQGMIDTARQVQVCEVIAANIRSACENSNASAANGFMAQAVDKNCPVDEGLWAWGNSLVTEHNQRIEEEMAAADRQVEAETQEVQLGVQQAADSLNWMDVAAMVVEGMQDVVDAREEHERSSGGTTAQPSSQIRLPDTGTLPPMWTSQGSSYPGSKDWASKAGLDWDKDSKKSQSQSNTSTGTSGASSTGADQAQSTSSGESLTGGGMTASACELKFCPICTNSDAGFGLLGVTISPQCNPCITRYKAKIADCEQGDSAARGHDKSDSQFQTYSLLECSQPKKDYEGKTLGYSITYAISGPNRKAPTGKSCSRILKGTYAQCSAEKAKYSSTYRSIN